MGRHTHSGGTHTKMVSPRTITIVALSFALGLFFVFMGTIKLTPRLSKDAYSEMKRAYKSYAKALPGLKKLGVSSVLLRKIIGSLEVGEDRLEREESREEQVNAEEKNKVKQS